MTAADHPRGTEPPADPKPDDTSDDTSDDTVDDAPATSGHSGADTQTQRNVDDESPS